MTIKVDVSDATTLVYCTTAGCHWRVLRSSRGSAYEAGVIHQRSAHSEDRRGVRDVEELARRHAR